MRAIFVMRAVTGVLFLVQLVLGILFCTGHANELTQLHMAIGALFVIALWIQAGLCARAGAPRGPVIGLVVLGAVIPVVGMTQMAILPGASHWVIRVIHLLLALAAMPLAGRLTRMVRSDRVKLEPREARA